MIHTHECPPAPESKEYTAIEFGEDGWELKDKWEGNSFQIFYCPFCGQKLETPKTGE